MERALLALSKTMTEADYDKLESQLHLRAACLGWAGHPMEQPPAVVLAIARQILADRQPAQQLELLSVEPAGNHWRNGQ
jgi:hypothetical protein